MNATEMIVLTRESNINNTIIAHKNIIKIKKYKKLMIFRIIFEESKKILKFNEIINQKHYFNNDLTTRKS